MDPVVLDLPTTAWERPSATETTSGLSVPKWRNILRTSLFNEWVADGGEGWGETLFLPCAPRPQSSGDSLKDRANNAPDVGRFTTSISCLPPWVCEEKKAQDAFHGGKRRKWILKRQRKCGLRKGQRRKTNESKTRLQYLVNSEWIWYIWFENKL